MNILPAEFQKERQKLKRVHETEVVNRSLTENLADYEEKLIRQALLEHNWNQSKAARVLNISEQTIRYKMKKLGIITPDRVN